MLRAISGELARNQRQNPFGSDDKKILCYETSRVNERETRKRVESTEKKKKRTLEEGLGTSEGEDTGIVGRVVWGRVVGVVCCSVALLFEEEELNC